MKTIKIRIKPSTVQADINTKGDKAQLNIGGNVVYQPLDCSTTINEDINATITRNGEYHYGYNPLTSTGLGSVDLSVNIPPQYVPVPGEMGTQGYQGTQGFAGTPGEQGVQGFPGTPGEQGIDGQPGPMGTQGYQGTQGEKGSQGEPGTPGEDGIQGMVGTQGYQGTQGLEGPQGPTGEQGSQGEPGPVDLENYYTKDEIDSSLNVIDTSINNLEDQFQQILDGEGEIIVHGTQGERGTQGYEGAQGLPGPQGEAGTPGEQGTQGEKGSQGEPGTPGEAGTQGERGTQGYEGSQGLPGPQGEAGTPGEQGTQGVPGTPGEQGAQGYPGTQGYQGTQGARGAQGYPGQPGPDGSSGPATILKALDEFPQDASAGDVVAIRTLVGPVWGYWTEDPDNYFTFTVDTENEELQDAEETTILSFMNGDSLYRYALYYDASGNLCHKIYDDDDIFIDSPGVISFNTNQYPGVHISINNPSGIHVWAEDASDNYIPYDYTLGGEGTMNFATYQYDGDTWNIIGGDEPDLTNYYTKAEIDASMNVIDSSIQQLVNDSSIFVKSYECTWIKVMTEAQYEQITPDASVFYVLL